MDFPPDGILWGMRCPTTARREAMFCQAGFDPWLRTLVQHLPHLSKPQATGLALRSCGTGLGLEVVWVYRGCALPVAWVVVPATPKHAWRRAWRRRRRPASPRGWTVIGLAERGLYAPWLFRRIVRLGWHPLLRLKTGGSFRP